MDNYTSILICNHKPFINLYCEGKEIAIYHKDKKQLQIKEAANKEDFSKIEDLLTFLILALNVNKNILAKPE
jgi:hypothetical protein